MRNPRQMKRRATVGFGLVGLLLGGGRARRSFLPKIAALFSTKTPASSSHRRVHEGFNNEFQRLPLELKERMRARYAVCAYAGEATLRGPPLDRAHAIDSARASAMRRVVARPGRATTSGTSTTGMPMP